MADTTSPAPMLKREKSKQGIYLGPLGGAGSGPAFPKKTRRRQLQLNCSTVGPSLGK